MTGLDLMVCVGLLVAVFVAVWLWALLDLVADTARDTVTRILLVVLLILLPPVGLVLWGMVRRPGHLRALAVCLGMTGMVLPILAVLAVALGVVNGRGTVAVQHLVVMPTVQRDAAAFPGSPVTTSMTLDTRCGVRWLRIDGMTYDATPPLVGPDGGAPAGWSSPSDSGTVTSDVSGNLTFRDAAGHTATFTVRPAGAPMLVPACG